MVRLVQFINNFVASSGKESGESVYDVVIGHVTDQAFVYHLHPHGVWDWIGNFAFKLNSLLGFQVPDSVPSVVTMHGHSIEVIQAKAAKFFPGVMGGFDLRITKWVLMLWLALFVCAVVFIPTARKIRKSPMGSASRWVNLWESMIGFVHDDIVEPNFDKKYVKKAMPYFCSLFFFLLFANYLGLVPGLATSTGNLAVTLGMALFTLAGMVLVGLVKQGPLWIFSGIVPSGVPAVMYILLWPIEFMGLLIKPFALTVRLFANMTAGHIVIIVFIYLIMLFQSYTVGVGSVTLSLMIYLLELLVAFIQAYIFASLSAMFIGASMHAH